MKVSALSIIAIALFFTTISAYAASPQCQLVNGEFNQVCADKLTALAPNFTAFVKAYETQEKAKCQIDATKTQVHQGIPATGKVVFACAVPTDVTGQSAFSVDISGEFGVKIDNSVMLHVLNTSMYGAE